MNRTEFCETENKVVTNDGYEVVRIEIEAIGAPVLLMQGNPRQVVAANRRALRLFEKELHEVEGHRGGQVFDCIHAFTEDGCGRDINCQGCKIRDAIIDTFATAKPHNEVPTTLQIKKPNGTTTYVLQVSTEKVGDLALVRIERFDEARSAAPRGLLATGKEVISSSRRS